MLLFLDESYEADDTGKFRYAYAGFAIDERQYRRLVAAVYQLKLHFWVDSSTTAGSQVADIIAHVLMNSMRPATRRKNLQELWRKVAALEFRSVDMRTRGIRKLLTK